MVLDLPHSPPCPIAPLPTPAIVLICIPCLPGNPDKSIWDLEKLLLQCKG